MSDDLTDFESEVLDFLKKRGDMLTTNIPPRMSGAIPNLRQKGFVDVYKRTTSRWASKKRKFVTTMKPGDSANRIAS
jgi:hypothetical protein